MAANKPTVGGIYASKEKRVEQKVSAEPTAAAPKEDSTSIEHEMMSQKAVVVEKSKIDDRPQAQYDSIVAGGGPAGLLTAIMLTQKYGPSHRIAVCERRSAIPPSPSDQEVWDDVAGFYLLGIGFRGQRALRKFGVLEDFNKASVIVKGRRDWQPGQTKVEDGKTTDAQKDVLTSVLARDKLVGVLHHHLVDNYINNEEVNAQIDLLYGYEVHPIDFGKEDDLVKVRITKCEDVASGGTGNATSGTIALAPSKAVSGTIALTPSNAEYTASQDSEQACDVDLYQESTTKLLIGADGAARTVANAMERYDEEKYMKMNPMKRLLQPKPFKVTRYDDNNPRLFKSVPIRLPEDWPKGLNYSARSRNSRVTLEALPSSEDMLCALLLLKPEDEFSKPNGDPAALRNFFDEEFPQFGALIDDEEMARVAKKPSSTLPAFRYAGPTLHLGKRTLVLGDAAHTVKPYYGLGCNTALEDVEILSEILDENEETDASNDEDPIISKSVVETFSKRRGADSEALVKISRNMDRPGKKVFFLTFVLPLILDGIFNKLAPKIFAPNMFRMFQRQDIGFKQIQRKKRLDRIMQVSILGMGFTGSGLLVKLAIDCLAKAIGKSSKVVSLGLFLMGIVYSTIKKTVPSKKSTKA